MSEKIFRWVFFSVLVSLLPFVWSCVSLITQQKTVSLEIMFSRGEILLVSCALCAAAFGDLIGTGRNFIKYKIVVGFGCVAILALDSLWYSQISFHVLSLSEYNMTFVTIGSLIAFIFTLVTALGALILAEADK